MDEREQERKPGSAPGSWTSLIWFALLTLALVWVWQEGAHRVGVKTIPYSQFKEYVRSRDVVACDVGQTEITGEIQLHQGKSLENPSAKAPGAAEASAKPGESKTEQAGQAPEQAQPTPHGSGAPPSPPAPKGQAQGQEQAQGSSKAGSNQNRAIPRGSPDGNHFSFRTVRVTDPQLVQDLEAAGVPFSGQAPSVLSEFLLAWLVPIGLMVLIWIYLSRRMRGMGRSVMGFGSSRARLIARKSTGVTFDDVAGCDEAKYELQEVVDFLKHAEHYRALGAKIPKGVLLVGPPGTGKTLLARAVAGEARVPFFLISGSEFVEMFVGVGAARVRELFEQAKRLAPCIVFIDELDAIGRQRGVRAGVANDEREQTLNQLLVGLDGFEANVGVVVLAATNRPEILDRALLRPGRFDREIVVDAPDLRGRTEVLKLHAKGKPIDPAADLHKIAAETPGFSGADLANVINEAALLAARHQGTMIGQKDLEDAVEKVVAGPERKSRRLSDDDKRRVAYHEVGHALVSASTKSGEVLRKISIVPRGRGALGYTFQSPDSDRYLMSEEELLDKVASLLGGRAAEEITFGVITTGAENDLDHATVIARQMVCVYGMSKSVGLVHCAQRMNPFLAVNGDGSMERDCSEQTAREVDEEVKAILERSYGRAKEILQRRRATLEVVATELLKRETLDAEAFLKLIGKP